MEKPDWLQIDADPDPNYHFYDPDEADVDQDPGYQNDADPDPNPQHCNVHTKACTWSEEAIESVRCLLSEPLRSDRSPNWKIHSINKKFFRKQA